MLTIRIADINEAALIADFSRKTFIETFASLNTKENMEIFMEESFSRELLIQEVGSIGNIFLIAYENEIPVGYAKIKEAYTPPTIMDENSIEIARIYVLKDSIGKGVGKLLMNECIKIAIEKKKDIIWLGVWEHNQQAIDFYKKWEFEKFSTQIFKLGKDNQIDWLMKKVLN